jgi:DNA-directed RNA polymerase specialized sigma24 family protein
MLSYQETEESFFLIPPKKNLLNLISILKPSFKQVITYRYVNGYTFSQIQSLISQQEGEDISINTILGRMRYALLHLKKEAKRHNYKKEDLEDQICFLH